MAARRYDVANKPAGSRNGPLGTVAIEILDYLCNLIDFRSGRLEPSLETIMKKLRRSRDAVVRGLKALRNHGFVDWLRRYVPVPADGKGPQMKQASNAYRLSLPDKARACLGRYGDVHPCPEDFEDLQNEKAKLIEEHRAGLGLAQRALFDVGDNAIGRALARLGARMMERESAKQAVSLSRSISEGEGPPREDDNTTSASFRDRTMS